MFLNYVLDLNIRAYAGVDVTEVAKQEGNRKKHVFEHWNLTLMGFCPSPFDTTQQFGGVRMSLSVTMTTQRM